MFGSLLKDVWTTLLYCIVCNFLYILYILSGFNLLITDHQTVTIYEYSKIHFWFPYIKWFKTCCKYTKDRERLVCKWTLFAWCSTIMFQIRTLTAQCTFDLSFDHSSRRICSLCTLTNLYVFVDLLYTGHCFVVVVFL